MQFRILLILSVFASPSLFAQPGCTDPQALNFAPQAQVNDGSCLYASGNFTLQPVTILPDELREISGHVYSDGKWWAHEDGFTDPFFYQIDPLDGQIQQTITLENGQNKDWEEMTANNTHLFLGDFGNNQNNREDLGIYKVPLDAIAPGSVVNIPASVWTFIPFSYPDQTDFTTVPPDSTTFDCEAFIWKNSKLHLFTKNWKTYQTTHYIVDSENGATTLLETFNTNGLITGAAISPDSQLVVLLGYNLKTQYAAFAWLVWDWPDPQGDWMFTGNKRRIELGSVLFSGQVESIAFKDNRSGYIGNERSTAAGTVFAQQAFKSFDFAAWVPEDMPSAVTPVADEFLLNVRPQLFSGNLDITCNGCLQTAYFRIINPAGRVMYESAGCNASVETYSWENGFYLVELSHDNQVFRKKVIKVK